MKKERITILYPMQPTSNRDVAHGYVNAFRLLGHNVDEIKYQAMFREWSEYYRFFGIIKGVPGYSYEKEDVMRTASLHAVIKAMESDPDILIVVDGIGLHKMAWEWTRKLPFKTVLVATECPYQDKLVGYTATYPDICFANDSMSAKNLGINYLPVAYDTQVHYPSSVPDTMRHDVVFVGSGFPERVEILEGVEWDGIDFEFYGHYQIDHDHTLAKYYKDSSLPNALAATLYSGAKISINLNRTSVDYDGTQRIPEAHSLSARPYEIAACGGFLISEWRPEIDALFGDLVPTFKTADELNELIKYWLPRDYERAEISGALRESVGNMSYIDRANDIMRKVAGT